MKYFISSDTNFIRQENAAEWGIDQVIVLGSDLTNNLSGLPQGRDSFVFFVPTVFDYSNSLYYGGANLALRILMHYIRQGKTDIDIVLLGNESEKNFLLHYDYPNILKIPCISYTIFNKQNIASFDVPVHRILRPDEYRYYLDNLGLKIPSSFKSTHSLTNEWCLFKWNSFMGFHADTSTLEGHLYFDFIITIEQLNKVRSKQATEYLKKRIHNLPRARILLIDDKKGWHTFFKNMFSETENIELHYLGEDFNKLQFGDIEKKVNDKIKDFKPHVIILDFRLMEDQDAVISDDMKKISGYQVLAKILKGTYKAPRQSFGRQVLIFTASSRIENILLLKEAGADGFILKEKPETYNGKEITKDLISKMVSKLDNAFARSKFLIPLNKNLDKLVELANYTQRQDSETSSVIEIVAQSVRQLTQNNELNKDILKLVYLNLISILESLKDRRTENLQVFIENEAAKLHLNSDIILLWEDICSLRNCLAHGHLEVQKGKLKYLPISFEILSEQTLNLTVFIIDFLKLYLQKNNGID